MIVYRVEEGGRCQAVQYPTHTHLIQMIRAHGLNHMLS